MPKKSTAWKYTVAERVSTAVEALESAWEMLRKLEPGVPPMPIVDQPSAALHRAQVKTTRPAARPIVAAVAAAAAPELLG